MGATRLRLSHRQMISLMLKRCKSSIFIPANFQVISTRWKSLIAGVLSPHKTLYVLTLTIVLWKHCMAEAHLRRQAKRQSPGGVGGGLCADDEGRRKSDGGGRGERAGGGPAPASGGRHLVRERMGHPLVASWKAQRGTKSHPPPEGW